MSEGGKKQRKLLEPIDRVHSRDFDLRVNLSSPTLGNYDAMNDPYCPLTHTAKFIKRVNKTLSRSFEFQTSMKTLDAPMFEPVEKFPKHTVTNFNISNELGGHSGLTYSAEIRGETEEGFAELEVLKSILNREEYLNRLATASRALGKVFDPAVADLLDLVRVASLDTVEKILRWRESKKDHDAAFMWNGINYLLKMPSDLDFLCTYLSVKKWIGFSMQRNPFGVPFPMENGVDMLSDNVMAPKHVSGGLFEGFAIGGLSAKTMAKNYTMKRESRSAGNKVVLGAPYSLEQAVNDGSKRVRGSAKKDLGANAQSLILNEDMVKIRQAELVLLKEEEKFGKLSRDPIGNLVPIDQAEARLVAYELEKDHRRPISDPAKSLIEKVSLHAAKGGVGVEEQPWHPPEVDKAFFAHSDKLEKSDKSLSAKSRGKDKIGGLLAPLEAKGAETRAHYPLKVNLNGNMEFRNARKKKTIGDRLEEITKLKEQIKLQRLELEKERLRSRQRFRGGTASSEQRGISTANTTNSDSAPLLRPLSSSLEFTSRPGSMKSNCDFIEPVKDEIQVGFEESDSRRLSSSSSINRGLSEDEKLMRTENDLSIEVTAKIRNLDAVGKTIDHISSLKDKQRESHGMERSRDIERRRRHLTAEEAVRKGPPPEDENNIYDYMATRIQSELRGWITRCWYAWYKVACITASTSIQAGIRGMLARRKISRILRRKRAATDVQRMFRGWQSRGGAAMMARGAELAKQGIKIQCFWRILMAKKRIALKRLLDTSARMAFDVVDTNCLFVSDVKELANRITTSLNEPDLVPMPPDEVLFLIRIIAMMIQKARGLVGLSTYSFMNTRYYGEVDGEQLSWEQAAQYLNRSERFLRMVRSLAFGPAARPPRLIQIPDTVVLLNTALKNNPRWNLETFELMGGGAKAAAQLFKWFMNIVIVSDQQKVFIKFLSNSYPAWLPKFMELQRGMRKYEFEIAMTERCLIRLDDALVGVSEFFFRKTIETHHSQISDVLRSHKEELERYTYEISKLKSDETTRETFSMLSFEENVLKNEDKLNNISAEYQETLLSAEKGHRLSELNLPGIRDRLTVQKLMVTELKSQFALLKSQVLRNSGRRVDPAKLPAGILTQAFSCGESWAMQLIAETKRDEFLYDAGVTQEFKLSPAMLEKFKVLKKDVEYRIETKAERYNAAQEERRQHDRNLEKALEQNRILEEKSREDIVPTEIELEEERREDEIEAQNERLRKKQGLSPQILQTFKKRERPVVIAFARDVPFYSKNEIFKAITRSMPGMFVTLDQNDNMGINVQVMQDIIDSHKSIIVTVDHGNSRLTRENFVRNFELCLNSLIPKPCVVIVIGEDSNRRSTSEYGFGVHMNDLNAMRDADIKIALQNIAWVPHEIVKPDFRESMMKIGYELMAPSPSFVIVMEALFILYSGHDNYTRPDKTLSSVSWRITRSLFNDPDALCNRLREIKRGQASFHLMNTIREYIAHFNWPPVGCKERFGNKVLDIFAFYVEQWAIVEKSTAERGGVPDRGLFKSALKGVQAVISVKDPVDVSDRSESWKSSYYYTLRAVLQDVRVLKCVQKVGGIVHNLNVYREEGRVYFDAYDPVLSKIYATDISIEDVPGLVIPNATDRDRGNFSTPTDPGALYEALVKLLMFDSKNIRTKQLICKRGFDFLCRVQRKINGYTVLVYCYEAALGQLYIEAILLQYSARLKFSLDDTLRMKLLDNADPVLEPTVTELETDARKFLPYVLDRMRILPSVNNLEILQGQFKNVKFNDSAQGFSLALRLKGGAGRPLTSFLMNFTGVQFLIIVKSCPSSKVLRLLLYQPRNRLTKEFRMNSYQRNVLFGTDNEELISWLDKLKSRLRLDWRGKHTFSVDFSILKCIRKVAGLLLAVEVSLHPTSEDSVIVKFFDSRNCDSYQCIVDKEALVRILRYKLKIEIAAPVKAPVPEKVMKVKGGGVSGGIKTPDRAKTPDKSSRAVDKSTSAKVDKIVRKINDQSIAESVQDTIDPFDFEVPFINIIRNKSHLIDLVDKLAVLMEKTTEQFSERCIGFYLKVPVSLECNLQPKVQNLDAFDFNIRELPRLVQGPRGIDLAGVIRSRRQPEFVVMENELDKLAEERDREARRVRDENIQALSALALSITQGDLPVEALDLTINKAATTATEAIISQIEDAENERIEERQTPQIFHEKRMVVIMASNGLSSREVHLDDLDEHQREIATSGEKLVFEHGVKVNFREGKGRWQGHVSVRIFEGLSWSPMFGIGNKFKFIVYDPTTAAYYEGHIRSNTHLREVLGKHGQDLADKKKKQEMLLFVCKYRLDMVKNTTTWDGEPVEEGAPAYRLEFQSERLYDNSKITPVNAIGAEDQAANEEKLIDLAATRGKKILRLTRKVSGLLLQITVFELLTAAESVEASERAKLAFEEALAPTGTSASAELKDKRRRNKVSSKIPPKFKVIAYDPFSKKKSILMVDPEACTELAGGGFSPFLELDRRRELAKIVCDSLLLTFPKGQGYQIFVPWSGMDKSETAATASSGKTSTRSTAERVIRRPGKIFRGGVRIGEMDIVITVYSQPAPKASGYAPDARQLVFNFYSVEASEAIEMIITDEEQLDRLGRTILSYADGEARAIAVRRFCKNFKCEIMDDEIIESKKNLVVEFLEKRENFVEDYKQVGLGEPGENLRTYGAPFVFMPLHVKGELIFRKVITINVKPITVDVEYVVSIYGCRKGSTPDKGLVVRLYERGTSDTSVLHVQPVEIGRLCVESDELELLNDIKKLRNDLDNIELDALEQAFVILSEKGDKEILYRTMVQHLAEIVIADLAVKKDAQGFDIPYLKSAKPYPEDSVNG